MSFIKRESYVEHIKKFFGIFPIVALLGPRQCGKTTLANKFCESLSKQAHYYDLEDPHCAILQNESMTILEDLQGYVVIDEIQRNPKLFPILRVLADRNRKTTKYLILGSATGELAKSCSESLAGRVGQIEVGGFSLSEIKFQQDQLWERGGFPLSFLSKDSESSFIWRTEFIKTFLERDLSVFGKNISIQNIWKFWQMASHYSGNILNSSELSRSLGVSHKTIKHYLDVLSDSFMIRQLQPWFINQKKRIIKSPKIYIRDSGILHAILELKSLKDLQRNPKLGASWEGFALEQVIKAHKVNKPCFWRAVSGNEIDLLFKREGKMIGLEFKYADSPKVTASMKKAIQELELEHMYIITPKGKTLKLGEQITSCSLSNYIIQNNLLRS